MSAKGIVNGLSNEPNDGCDFGPDTYNPDYSGSGIPYTQTSGIQEALNYAIQTNISGSSIIEVRLSNGEFNCSVDVYIPQTDYWMGISGSGGNVSSSRIMFEYANAKGLVFDSLTSVIYISGIAIHNTKSSVTVDSLMYFNNCADANFAIRTFDVGVWTAGSTTYGGLVYVDGLNDMKCIYTLFDGNGFSGPANSNNFNGATNVNFLSLNSCEFNGENSFNSGEHVIFNNCYNLSTYQINGNVKKFTAVHCSMYGSTLMSVRADTGDIIFDDIYFATASSTTNPQLINSPDAVSSTNTAGNITLRDILVVNNGTVSGTYYPIAYSSSGNTLSYSIVPVRLVLSNLRSVAGTGIAIPFVQPLTTSSRTPSPPYISANPPVSGTSYQNTNPYDILIYLPSYATSSGTAGSVAVAIGSSSTPSTTFTQFISGSTSSSSPDTIQIKVPAGWYYEVTTTGVTLATATVVAD